MQYYQVGLIGSEMQVSQLLFNCGSSGFLNAAVRATWHVSISRCGSGLLSLHLSHLGVGVMRHGCHEVAYVERGLRLSDATSSCLIANQRRCLTVAWRCSFDPVYFREYHRCPTKLQKILDMK